MLNDDMYPEIDDALAAAVHERDALRARVKGLEADVEHLQDEVNTLRAWLAWLTLIGAGFAVLGIVAFAFLCTYPR